MQLLKIQCQSCASPMEVKPGIDRVRCPACGMTYLIERDRASHPGIPADASGDNPVDVMLVPFPHNTISLGKNTLKNIPVLKDLSMDQHLLPRDSSWTGLSKDLDVHLAFLARLVYATGETYTLDIGNFALDPVMMYYQGSDRHITGALSEEQIRCLVEPRKMTKDTLRYSRGYLHHHRYGYRVYDQNVNAKKNQAVKAELDAVIRKYHLQVADTEKFTLPEVEKYYRKTLFGHKEAQRYWVRRYTDRRLFLTLDPHLARTFLSGDAVSRMDRMGALACIQDMAAIIYREFRKENQPGLNTQGYMNLELEPSQIVIKNIRYDVRQTDHSNHWHADDWVYITFSHYGMQPLANQEQADMLAAHLIRGLKDLIRANHDMEWTLTEWYNYTGYSHPYGLDMKFMPSVKPVGIYNSWV
ncbi:MAG: hypothetical protein IJ210_11080 [Clostridia bacterium]|nr:hypothetical protein [Clostridia bacterium]